MQGLGSFKYTKEKEKGGGGVGWGGGAKGAGEMTVMEGFLMDISFAFNHIHLQMLSYVSE